MEPARRTNFQVLDARRDEARIAIRSRAGTRMDNRRLDANLPAQGAPLRGCRGAEAARRLAQYGENALAEHYISALERLARFF